MTINNPQVKRRDLLKAGVAASAAMTVGIPLSEVAKAAIEQRSAIVWTKGVAVSAGTGCGLQVGVRTAVLLHQKATRMHPLTRA